jgi:rod shape-determining protein MreD
MAEIYKRRPEVYHFHPAVVPIAVGLAVFLQSALPLYLPFQGLLSLLELPLLVVVYFALSRRNPSTGLLLGLVVGLLQDALSYTPIGLYGMAKTLMGYVASSLSSRIDTDRAQPRLLLLFGFYYLHQVVYALEQRLLLNQPADFISLPVLEGALVNALLGVLVFHLLDRFRRTT